MTEHYITLFDAGYLPNGIALHRSLIRHAGEFTLWVLCMDERTQEALDNLGLPGLRTIPLAAAETSELLAVKPGRSIGEYCWTLTPFTPDMVFLRDSTAVRATYIDADMWLTADPAPIFDELDSAKAGVLITDHAYATEYQQAERYGRYCVQFMPFVRGPGDGPRMWWQERVLDWCFAREEGGRFGDQKYLDDWPERFGPAVRVLAEPQWTQAPWNAVRFPADQARMYHFHRLRITGPHTVSVGLYRLPNQTQERLYRPYLADLRWAVDLLARAGTTLPVQQAPLTGWTGIKDWLAFRLHNWRSPLTPYTMHF